MFSEPTIGLLETIIFLLLGGIISICAWYIKRLTARIDNLNKTIIKMEREFSKINNDFSLKCQEIDLRLKNMEEKQKK